MEDNCPVCGWYIDDDISWYLEEPTDYFYECGSCEVCDE
jgi:hypothetical protein